MLAVFTCHNVIDCTAASPLIYFSFLCVKNCRRIFPSFNRLINRDYFFFCLQNNGFFTLLLPLSETGDDCTAKKIKNTNKGWWYKMCRNCKNSQFFFLKGFIFPCALLFFFLHLYVWSLRFAFLARPPACLLGPETTTQLAFSEGHCNVDSPCLSVCSVTLCVSVVVSVLSVCPLASVSQHNMEKGRCSTTPLVYGWVSECRLHGVRWH